MHQRNAITFILAYFLPVWPLLCWILHAAPRTVQHSTHTHTTIDTEKLNWLRKFSSMPPNNRCETRSEIEFHCTYWCLSLASHTNQFWFGKIFIETYPSVCVLCVRVTRALENSHGKVYFLLRKRIFLTSIFPSHFVDRSKKCAHHKSNSIRKFIFRLWFLQHAMQTQSKLISKLHDEIIGRMKAIKRFCDLSVVTIKYHK